MKSTKVKITIFVIAIIAMLSMNISDANANVSEQTYQVFVTYYADGSRSEIWMSKFFLMVVYIEITDSDGNTTLKHGKKPVVGNRGKELWTAAENLSAATSVSVAEALCAYYPPKDSTSGKDSVANWKHYEFDFPISWLVSDGTLADISFNTLENSIVVNTDKPIRIKLVDLQTGAVLVDFVDVYESYPILTSGLPLGCKYSINVYQDIPELNGIVLVNSYNFCVTN